MSQKSRRRRSRREFGARRDESSLDVLCGGTAFRARGARGMHADLYMNVSFNPEQTELVRDTLQHALMELRVETARTDSTRYRQMLRHREEVLAAALAQLNPLT
jgi:hypothetical protein